MIAQNLHLKEHCYAQATQIIVWSKGMFKFNLDIGYALPGLSEFLRPLTFQMLWPLATTNCSGQRPRIASL